MVHTFDPESIVWPMLGYTIPFNSIPWPNSTLSRPSFVRREVKYLEHAYGNHLEGFIYVLQGDLKKLNTDEPIWFNFIATDIYSSSLIYEDRVSLIKRRYQKHKQLSCPVVSLRSHLEAYQLHKTYAQIEYPNLPKLVLSHPYAYYPRKDRAHSHHWLLEVNSFVEREAYLVEASKGYAIMEDTHYGKLYAKVCTNEVLKEGDTVRYFGYPHQTKPMGCNILNKVNLQENLTGIL